MSGVPLVDAGRPEWTRRILNHALVSEIDDPGKLLDPLTREELSIRQRRAALTAHASEGWRRTLSQLGSFGHGAPTRVSVVLATRRPAMIPFALRQVARQRGCELELVLVTHGFEAPPRELERFSEATGGAVAVVAISAPAELPFGDVLNRGARASSGDVLLKMDDDDWYGPDFVCDLLLARRYSGADIVGCPPEFTYLEALRLTTRARARTEHYGRQVAGGTMLIGREAFAAVGGFRSSVKYVDMTLHHAIRDAGGVVYRGHGLGYVLRRTAQGHTWDPGLPYFLTKQRASMQWRGFRPSRLLEAHPMDQPSNPEGPVNHRD
jgi:hypothetical protein